MTRRLPHSPRWFALSLLMTGVFLLSLILSDRLPIVWTGRGIGAGLDGGVCAVEWWDAADAEMTDWRDPGWRLGHNDFGMFGWFGWRAYDSYRIIEVRLWMPLAASIATTVLLAVVALRHARRPLPGHCTSCRYDLRGLPTIAAAPLLCPECGRPSAAPTPQCA